MLYAQILESPEREGLESKVNTALQQGAKPIGYAIHPGTSSKAAEYTCLVLFYGEPPLFRTTTGSFQTVNETSAISEEICVMERPIILALLEDSLDREHFIFRNDVFESYGFSPGELAHRYRIYKDINGSDIGKGVTFDDIKNYGIKEAAHRQEYGPKELWNQYQIKLGELSAFFGGSKRKIDYQWLADSLKLTVEELKEMVTPKQRYDIKKVLAKIGQG